MGHFGVLRHGADRDSHATADPATTCPAAL